MDQSFRALKNLDAGKVRGGAMQFAKNAGLSSRQTALLVDAINVRTAADFRGAIAKAVAHLKAKVRGRPYALLIESSSAGSVKSSVWLAPQVVRALGPPTGIVNYDTWAKKFGYKPVSGPSNTLADRTVDKRGLIAAASDGAKCVVHLNDAVYTGKQLADLMKQAYDEMLWATGRRLAPPPPFFVAAAYGRAGIAEYFSRTIDEHLGQMPATDVYFAKTIPSRHDVVKLVTPDMTRVSPNFNPASMFTILPHKVPNHVSFGLMYHSDTRSYILRDYVVNALGINKAAPLEPYKRITTREGNMNLREFIAASQKAAQNAAQKAAQKAAQNAAQRAAPRRSSRLAVPTKK